MQEPFTYVFILSVYPCIVEPSTIHFIRTVSVVYTV